MKKTRLQSNLPRAVWLVKVIIEEQYTLYIDIHTDNN